MLTLLTIAFATTPQYQQPVGWGEFELVRTGPDGPQTLYAYREGARYTLLDAERRVVETVDRQATEPRLVHPGWEVRPMDRNADDAIRSYPVALDHPPVVRTVDADVVLFHDVSGLWRWPLGEAPQRIHAEPVTTWNDLDSQTFWTLPVQDPETRAIGSLSGNQLFWHGEDGTPLETWTLPGDPEMPGWWQVFAGPDGRVALTRMAKNGRQLWVRVDGEWQRSRARVYNYIRQNVDWFVTPEGEYRMLISDGKYGTTLADDSGAVLATHRPRLSWRRYGRAVLSPDQQRIAVSMGTASTDDDGGVYILDAADLSMIERDTELSTFFPNSEHEMAWQEDGLWLPAGSGVAAAAQWYRWDGEERPIASRWSRLSRLPRRTQVDGRGVVYTLVDGRSMLAPALGEQGPILQIDATGWSIQQLDGSVQCGGTGCERWRCVDSSGQLHAIEPEGCPEPPSPSAKSRRRKRRSAK